MRKEDISYLKKLLESKQNPISIITQQFDDIEIRDEFKDIYNISIIDGSPTWKKFLEQFYAMVKVRPLFADYSKKRVLIVNTDIIQRIPKEKRNSETNKPNSIKSLIQFIATRCPIKVIFLTEKPPNQYKMVVLPLEYGEIIDYGNYGYVADQFIHSLEYNYKINLLEKHHKEVGSLAFLVMLIQDYYYKYYPENEDIENIIRTFFKLQFEAKPEISYSHLALSVGFKEKKSVIFPKYFFKALGDKNVRSYEVKASYLKNL